MSIDDPSVIDFVASTDDGVVHLVMVEGREWNGSRERLHELRDKVEAYLEYALDGQLVRQYPALVGRPVRIELRTPTEPDMESWTFIGRLSERSMEFGIPIDVKVSGQGLA